MRSIRPTLALAAVLATQPALPAAAPKPTAAGQWPQAPPAKPMENGPVVPPYSSERGSFQGPAEPGGQRYDPDRGRFEVPDANTPGRFNPRDPNRGYTPPGSP